MFSTLSRQFRYRPNGLQIVWTERRLRALCPEKRLCKNAAIWKVRGILCVCLNHPLSYWQNMKFKWRPSLDKLFDCVWYTVWIEKDDLSGWILCCGFQSLVHVSLPLTYHPSRWLPSSKCSNILELSRASSLALDQGARPPTLSLGFAHFTTGSLPSSFWWLYPPD